MYLQLPTGLCQSMGRINLDPLFQMRSHHCVKPKRLVIVPKIAEMCGFGALQEVRNKEEAVY